MAASNKYHLQVTGPSGSGKSYFAKALSELGYPAFDADKISGLGRFLNSKGEEVEYDHEGGEEWLKENLWMWDLGRLEQFLNENGRVIIFGGAVNEDEAQKFFDKVFYLSLDKEQILANLRSENRSNPFGKTDAQQEFAAEKIDEFIKNVPQDWIPLTSRNPQDLVKEIEKSLGYNL